MQVDHTPRSAHSRRGGRLVARRISRYFEPVMRKFPLFFATALLFSACGEDDNTQSDKKNYEDSAKELATHIGVISIYLPYLEVPKADGKYDPRPAARDVQPRQERAANAMRMAAAAARQFGKSPVTKLLGDAFANLGRSCTRAEGDEAVKKCKDAVLALDVELEKQAKAASDAGATGKTPRIGPDAITDASKEAIAPYLRALGPTPKEMETLKSLNDPKADVANLTLGCDAAAEEQKLVEKTYEGVDEGLRKLAVKHRFAIEAICRVVKRIEASRAELRPCEEKKNIEKPECVLACSKGNNLVKEGMRAAAQETFPDYYKQICEEEAK